MLFNRSDNGIVELNELTGFFYKYNDFASIKNDLVLAQEDVAALIGVDMMNEIDSHYNGDNWGQESHVIQNNLVTHAQLTIAYMAIHSFSQNTDVKLFSLNTFTEKTDLGSSNIPIIQFDWIKFYSVGILPDILRNSLLSIFSTEDSILPNLNWLSAFSFSPIPIFMIQ